MRLSRPVNRVLLVALALLALLAAAIASGCSQPKVEPKPEAKVKPPAVAEPGVLRVGIDLTYPPFGGEDKGKQAGIDVDVAQALASSLNVQLRIVSLPSTQAVSALASGSVDAVMSVPITPSTVTSTSIVGSYIADGPAFFATSGATMTVEGMGSRSVGAQQGSKAYWTLEEALGEGVTQSFPDLRAALGALADGKMDVIVGDALVGAYIARDFPSVRFAGQMGPAQVLALAVAKDNVSLADALRQALDKLAADGVLSAVRAKWVGALPELEVAKD